MNTPKTPAARNSDPRTSHQAAAAMTKSGKRKAHLVRVLAGVKKYPGRTSAELAARLKMDRHAVARRLPELKGASVKQGDARKCRKNGTMAATWWPMPVDDRAESARQSGRNDRD